MQLVACAVVHNDPPEVYVAEDIDTLNRVIALRVIARTDPADVPSEARERIRRALLDEQWGEALEIWLDYWPDGIDVYGTHELFLARDVELVGEELQFAPLFRSP